MLTLQHVMTRAVVTIGMDDSLHRLQDIFRETGFHHLLVTDEDRLVGIISDRDLLAHLSPFIGRTMMERRQDVNTLKVKAHQIMTREVVTGHPEMTAKDGAQLLLDRRVSCLPVVGPGHRIEGIVSWRDLLPHCFACASPMGLAGSCDDDDLIAGIDRPLDDDPSARAA